MHHNQIPDTDLHSTTDMSLTRELKNLNKMEIDTLIQQIKVEFNRDIVTINESYKSQIQQLFSYEQSHFVDRVRDKIKSLQSIENQLNGIFRHKERADSIRLMRTQSEQQMVLGCGAHTGMILGMIDQVTKSIETYEQEIECPKTPNQHSENQIPNLKSTDAVPKITCTSCGQTDLEVVSFRRHQREVHNMVFTGYQCGHCDFNNKWITKYCDHMIQVHKKKTCICMDTFLAKSHFCDHLRSCLKFYHSSSDTTKSSNKKQKKNQ